MEAFCFGFIFQFINTNTTRFSIELGLDYILSFVVQMMSYPIEMEWI